MENNLYVSYSNLYNKLFQNFIPLAITSTILAPITRMKIILQNNKLISINEHEKVYKPRILIKSK